MYDDFDIELLKVVLSSLTTPGNTFCELFVLIVILGVIFWRKRK